MPALLNGLMKMCVVDFSVDQLERTDIDPYSIHKQNPTRFPNEVY